MIKKYWMVTDNKRIICGIGETPSQAKSDAKECVLGVIKQDRCAFKDLSHPIQCSKSLYNQVYCNGATKEDTWTLIGGLAFLDEHINTKENIAEMRSLIDGAYDVILMDKPESPAQKKWRDDWLEKSKKHGAGLDC